MKKEYTSPEMEIKEISFNDIIVTSEPPQFNKQSDELDLYY